MVKRTGYDKIDFISAEDWKCVSDAVLRKYAVSTNPNQLFKLRKVSSAGPKIYVKPPIGKKPDWL